MPASLRRDGRLRVGRLLGAQLLVHPTWFLGCAVFAWLLASNRHVAARAGPAALAEWHVLLVSAVLLPVLALLAEAAHSLIARRNGLRVGSVTLCLFGAVSDLANEPSDPRTELRVAAAGPGTSLALSALCALAALWVGPDGLAADIGRRLSWLNLALAGWALLPLRPLHGFRIVRALVWRFRGRAQATEFASVSALILALPVLALGIAALLSGRPRAAIVLLLLAQVLRLAGDRARRDLRVAAALEGATAEDAMAHRSVGVPGHVSLAEAEEYCSRGQADELPVTRDSTVVGLIGRRDLRHADDPHAVSVQAAMRPLPAGLLIAPQEALAAALARMSSLGAAVLFVVEDGRLRGILTPRSIDLYVDARLRLARQLSGHA